MMRLLNFFLLLSLQLVGFGESAIYEYRDVPLKNLFLKYRTGFMLPSEQSSIKFNFALTLVDPNIDNLEDNLVQVMVFPVEKFFEAYKLKHPDGEVPSLSALLEDRTACCGEDQASDPADEFCYQPNTLYSEEFSDIKDYITSYYFDFEPGDQNEDGSIYVDAIGYFPVKTQGLHALMFSYCQVSSSVVLINGHSTWMNPDGLLPAEMEGYLSFYSLISMMYVLVAIIWGYLCRKHWRNLLLLQNWITCVLILGMIEVNFRYFDFHTYNQSGFRQQNLMLFSLIFLSLKKALSRMLVIVVSMGFGVVKPTLGEEKSKVFYLGMAYFVLSLLDLVFMNFSSPAGNETHSVSSAASKLFLQLPLALIDGFLFLWIVKSLNTTLISLGKRNQDAKHLLYKRFKSMLMFTIALGLFWLVFSAVVKLTLTSPWTDDNYYSRLFTWQNLYLLECFWDVLYFVILLAVMVLWIPSERSMQYSYTAVKKNDDRFNAAEEFDDDLDNQDSSDLKLYKMRRSAENESFIGQPAQ